MPVVADYERRTVEVLEVHHPGHRRRRRRRARAIEPSWRGADHEGRQVAEKTGTWELGDKTTRNGDAWMIGYTPQLATAVWVGNVKDRKAIKYKDGRDISGARMPGDIFQRFMNDALKGKDKEEFPPAANVGEDDTGNGEAPAPPPNEPGQPGQNCDPLGLFCPGGTPGGGNPGGGNNPGGGLPGGGGRPGGGGGGGGLLPSTPPARQN